jgi:hypothetical protein
VAGIFLFLPLLARLRLDQLVRQAGYPGSRMVPAVSALLSLLALKLLDKERRSHISDFNFDEALGLFAGLNVLPKKSYATDYSYRTRRAQQRQLLVGWVAALAPLLFPQGHTFALDFHPIPYRGDPAGLDTHFIATRGKACPSVLSFFAQEHDSRVLCYANADLTRSTQAGEVMRFVEFWHEVSGQDPRWLYFDSKVAPYAELNRVNQRGLRFITIRRRGAAVIRRLQALPADAWQRAVIDIPKRRHKHIRFVEEIIRLSDYDATIRQVAVTGLGREQPTLLLSNDFDETARSLVALRGAEPCGRRVGPERELLPPGLLVQRGAVKRRSGRGPDGAGQRLLPLAGATTAIARQGGGETALPQVRGDGGHGRGSARTDCGAF